MAAEKPLLAWLKQCCHRLRSTTRVGSRLLTPAVWWFHTQFAGPRLILSEPQESEPKPSCHPSHPFTFIIYHHLSGHIRPHQAVLKWLVKPLSRHGLPRLWFWGLHGASVADPGDSTRVAAACVAGRQPSQPWRRSTWRTQLFFHFYQGKNVVETWSTRQNLGKTMHKLNNI